MTALILAVLNQSTDMTKLLLERGAANDLAEAVRTLNFQRSLILVHYSWLVVCSFRVG